MEETKPLLVRDIMVRDPEWVEPDVPVALAAQRMAERNIGAVVVCRDAVVGIFTERDLLRLVASDRSTVETPIRAVMTPNPATIEADQSWTAALELMSARHVRHLPVVEGGRLVGMLSIRDLMQHRTSHLEWQVKQRTAELETKNEELRRREELMHYHLDLASRIQRQMLPAAPPQLAPLSLAVAYHPLERVSGDYYDFAVLGPDRLGILIADASGHGVPAAFVSVMAKTAFHAYGHDIESPSHVLRTMNERLAHLMEAEHFITMFYAMIDCRKMEMTYAGAGHPPPVWHRRSAGAIQALDAPNPMIGVIPELHFEEMTIKLEPGDSLLFYTDGVIECRNREQHLFGQERLEKVLRSLPRVSSSDMILHVQAELMRFKEPLPFLDDVTCIALHVEG